MNYFLQNILAIDAEKLNLWQMCLRAVVVMPIALAYVRIAGMRAFGKKHAFDIVVALMLGAILKNAVTGETAFFPTLAASLILVLMHRLFARLAFSYPWMGEILKGSPVLVVKDGHFVRTSMCEAGLSEHDIMEASRENLHTDSISEVKKAFFERGGEISFLK